ncbi:hypothetical protein C8R44DRAFT_746237 [Mycena epipterygia]|nr:hypothetical protein C8R44DRAFT_746237 [Mycena epipterygia]
MPSRHHFYMPTASIPSVSPLDLITVVPGHIPAADYYLALMRDAAHEKQRLLNVRTYLRRQKVLITGDRANIRAQATITLLGTRIQRAAQRHAAAQHRVRMIRLLHLVAPVPVSSLLPHCSTSNGRVETIPIWRFFWRFHQRPAISIAMAHLRRHASPLSSLPTLMFTADAIEYRLVDAQDKALKREVLRSTGRPLTRKLERWIDGYLPPRRPSGQHRSSYFERRCAELDAKKARTTAFLALRAKALESRRKKWPRIWDSREKENQQLVNKARILADAYLAMKKEREARREREAADARVAVLMRHRNARKVCTGVGPRT